MSEMPTVTCDVCGLRITAEEVVEHMETHVAKEIEIPDMVGEIIGWRAWRVNVMSLDGQSVRLQSVTKRTAWLPNQWLHAKCEVGRHPDAKVPVKSCSCGIYAAKHRPHLTGMHYHVYEIDSTVVIGEVALAGKVVPGTQGWRAEKARPVRLLVPWTRWKLAQPLELTYGIPVELDNTLKKEDEEDDE
jgi:hypothetical protein